jgi:endonuclease YncB( thermonuclease family)
MPIVARVRVLAVVACLALAASGPATGVGPGSSARPSAATTIEGLLARPEGPTERASVVRIVDGDTIVVDRGRGKEKLRYIGIDTPESVKPDTPVEFMAKEATEANAALVDGQTVLLETDVSDTDDYGRLLRYVWIEDSQGPEGLLLVNLALVAHGFANAVTFPPDVRYADVFRQAERAARAQGLGLWGPATPAP